MISLILPTYHPGRVERANNLYRLLKNESGVEVEVIVVCDNPEIYDQLDHDVLVKLPRRIGFTRAMNIGEKFAKHKLSWWIDDYVIPEKNWGPKAVEYFYDKFPDGMGILELSQSNNSCPKSLSTRKFMYGLNGGNWIWNEYLHDGDTEAFEKARQLKKFEVYPEVLWNRNKIYDDCKAQTDIQNTFDKEIQEDRRSHGWPNTLDPKLRDKMELWAKENKQMELYNNIYNL